MAVKENWQQPRRRLLPPYGSRVSKNVKLCFPISPSLSKGHIKKGVGSKQLSEVILLQYICLFKSFSQQAVELGALCLKYINPTEEHGNSRASACHSKLSSTTAPCCTSKGQCLCFWKADSAVWEHMGWRESRRCRQDAEQPQWHSWNSNGVRPVTQATCSGEQALTAASTSCLKKWEMICKDGKWASALYPVGFLSKVWGFCLNSLSTPTHVLAEVFVHLV